MSSLNKLARALRVGTAIMASSACAVGTDESRGDMFTSPQNEQVEPGGEQADCVSEDLATIRALCNKNAVGVVCMVDVGYTDLGAPASAFAYVPCPSFTATETDDHMESAYPGGCTAVTDDLTTLGPDGKPCRSIY